MRTCTGLRVPESHRSQLIDGLALIVAAFPRLLAFVARGVAEIIEMRGVLAPAPGAELAAGRSRGKPVLRSCAVERGPRA